MHERWLWLEGLWRQPALEARPLRHLLAFLDGLEGERRARYVEAAAGLKERVVFTGRLEHEELADLLPACEALVVPSTFPEAFGMVAAEAAACGVLPLSAAHSGLAEVSDALARAVPEAGCRLALLPRGRWRRGGAGEACWSAGWSCRAELRARTRAGLVATVRERWSWDRVAHGVIAAAQGELEGLDEP